MGYLRAYKRIGFSLQQISDILNEASPQDMTGLLGEKEREIEDTIIYNINLLNRTRQIKGMFQEAEEASGGYRLELSPEIYRINTQECSG